MFLPLLPLLFADQVSVPQETTRATISVSANVAPQSSTFGSSNSGSGSSGARGNANVGTTIYPWTPLVDDDSPRSLQAFLQRTSFVSLGAGGLYTELGYSPAAGGGGYSQGYGSGSASTRYFFLPYLALVAGATVAYLHDERTPATTLPTTRSIWEPSGTIGVDARAGDASLVLNWQLEGASQSSTGNVAPAAPVFWPRFSLAGRIVVDRRYDLTAGAAALPDGVAVSAGFAAYPTKDLGLSISGEIEHGRIYVNSTTDYDTVLGGPQLSYWFTSRLYGWLGYTPQWLQWSTGTEWQHEITLGVTGRIP
jgi:hypothetical protein